MQSQVLVALEQLYSDRQSPDLKATRKTAGIWLEAFQKTVLSLLPINFYLLKPAAWGAADSLIRSDNPALEIKLFAAQTFRQKVTPLTIPLISATHRSSMTMSNWSQHIDPPCEPLSLPCCWTTSKTGLPPSQPNWSSPLPTWPSSTPNGKTRSRTWWRSSMPKTRKPSPSYSTIWPCLPKKLAKVTNSQSM